MTLAVFGVGMLALGGAVGFISGALGLGGGIFMVPAFLEFVPGMDEHTAKGTSLFIIVFVSAINVWRLNRGHAERQWRLAALVAPCAMLGGYLSSWITAQLPNRAVLWIFVGFLVLIGIRTFLIDAPRVKQEEVRRRVFGGSLIGLATGLVSGATGVGGGMVLVPLALMAKLVTNERVVALSNTVMVVTCIAASVAHFTAERTTELTWTFGQVNIGLAPLILIGSQAGAPLGVWVNARLNLRWRKAVMGALLLVIAARLAYRGLS